MSAFHRVFVILLVAGIFPASPGSSGNSQFRDSPAGVVDSLDGRAQDPLFSDSLKPGQMVSDALDEHYNSEQLTEKNDSGSKGTRIVISERRPEGKSLSGAESRHSDGDRVWKSQELDLLAVGMGIGDVDGDGQNEIVVIDPHNVYLYRLSSGKLNRVAEYSARTLELKSVDVAKLRKQGPARIYVTAQNRGTLASFVLEYRNGALEPVIRDFDYFLRVIVYPTQGPILLGQKKGLRNMYDGPVYRLTDKGDQLVLEGRFGIPLKIPVFGFTIGDFEGNRQPLIAVYDRNDHLRIYSPDGKRMYVSKAFYGGSDVLLRWAGPEKQTSRDSIRSDDEKDDVYFRPRIMSMDIDGDKTQQIIVISHSSKTMRLLGRSKMLEEGQVLGLLWNGDALDEKWGTPKLEGTITDFAVEKLPGLSGVRLVTLERKKTDWLAFLRSKSQIRAYDLPSLIREGLEGGGRRSPGD